MTGSVLFADRTFQSGTIVLKKTEEWIIQPFAGEYFYAQRSVDASQWRVVLSGLQPKKDFIAVKLELGDQQTLAHQDADGNWVLNDPPPNYTEELAKCQRYQWVPGELSVRAVYVVPSTCFFFMPIPVEMRANPTIDALLIRNLSATNQPGFTFTTTKISNANYLQIAAQKTSHGLSDAVLVIPNGTIIDANL